MGKDEQDHWTFPDDPEKEPRPGWGPFKFDWLMKAFKDEVEWHDRVTQQGSYAQKIGIPNWRIARAWRDMLDARARTYSGAGFIKRVAWAAGFFVARVNRYFYEGPLGKEPKLPQDSDNGGTF